MQTTSPAPASPLETIAVSRRPRLAAGVMCALVAGAVVGALPFGWVLRNATRWFGKLPGVAEVAPAVFDFQCEIWIAVVAAAVAGFAGSRVAQGKLPRVSVTALLVLVLGLVVQGDGCAVALRTHSGGGEAGLAMLLVAVLSLVFTVAAVPVVAGISLGLAPGVVVTVWPDPDRRFRTNAALAWLLSAAVASIGWRAWWGYAPLGTAAAAAAVVVAGWALRRGPAAGPRRVGAVAALALAVAMLATGAISAGVRLGAEAEPAHRAGLEPCLLAKDAIHWAALGTSEVARVRAEGPVFTVALSPYAAASAERALDRDVNGVECLDESTGSITRFSWRRAPLVRTQVEVTVTLRGAVPEPARSEIAAAIQREYRRTYWRVRVERRHEQFGGTVNDVDRALPAVLHDPRVASIHSDMVTPFDDAEADPDPVTVRFVTT